MYHVIFSEGVIVLCFSGFWQPVKSRQTLIKSIGSDMLTSWSEILLSSLPLTLFFDFAGAS